jgi:hypothetical protein
MRSLLQPPPQEDMISRTSTECRSSSSRGLRSGSMEGRAKKDGDRKRRRD